MLKLIQSNLSGAQMLDPLRRGHAVRRSCWIKGFYIRICNEHAYDENGLAIFERKTTLYTIATDGYFMHLAYSGQPFAKPSVWQDSGRSWRMNTREGEGVSMLFETDWEDYGFISRDDFDELTKREKPHILRRSRIAENKAIKEVINDKDSNNDPAPIEEMAAENLVDVIQSELELQEGEEEEDE